MDYTIDSYKCEICPAAFLSLFYLRSHCVKAHQLSKFVQDMKKKVKYFFITYIMFLFSISILISFLRGCYPYPHLLKTGPKFLVLFNQLNLHPNRRLIPIPKLFLRVRKRTPVAYALT